MFWTLGEDFCVLHWQQFSGLWREDARGEGDWLEAVARLPCGDDTCRTARCPACWTAREKPGPRTAPGGHGTGTLGLSLAPWPEEWRYFRLAATEAHWLTISESMQQPSEETWSHHKSHKRALHFCGASAKNTNRVELVVRTTFSQWY